MGKVKCQQIRPLFVIVSAIFFDIHNLKIEELLIFILPKGLNRVGVNLSCYHHNQPPLGFVFC